MKSEYKRLLACGLCAVTVALSGCKVFRNSCEAPTTAEEVATIPPLSPPAGITAPDTRNALRIPELTEAEKPPRAKSDPCLEEPPRYSPGWQPDEKAKEIKPGDPEAAPTEPKKKRKWWPWGRKS